jgi:putative hydrolase of the HAD superfamily
MTHRKYKHLFFDLDHTLWDFDTNSQVVLREIYTELDLGQYGIPSYEIFHATYLPVNAQYWAKYHHGLLTKDQLRIGRFVETLRRFRIDDIPLATVISGHYTERSPFQTALFPDAIETLSYLSAHYETHIITNGFEEIQGIKIKQSKLEGFFKHIFISEKIGHQKPEKEIFLHAMQATGATAADSLMIGDNMQTDIAGAKSVGMDQVFFNPNLLKTRDKATYEVNGLKELRNIL